MPTMITFRGKTGILQPVCQCPSHRQAEGVATQRQIFEINDIDPTTGLVSGLVIYKPCSVLYHPLAVGFANVCYHRWSGPAEFLLRSPTEGSSAGRHHSCTGASTRKRCTDPTGRAGMHGLRRDLLTKVVSN